MIRFSRLAAVAALVTVLLGALPTPAAAAPRRDGFGEASGRIQQLVEWRIVNWLLRALSRTSPGLTNVHAAEGANILP